ncbi:hypothetical protein P2318_17050 [Myxococcaceae bacterium GXIMD 01537]
MDLSRLEQLGLTVEEGAAGARATLDLSSALINPVTRQAIEQATFLLVGDRLLPSEPPELAGLSPILVSAVGDAADIESLVADAFNEHVFHLQRRSAELQVLGLNPEVHPETLELTVLLKEGTSAFTLKADRLGNFRVERAERDGAELPGAGSHTFELSEFRERAALAGYLGALFGEVPRTPAAPAGAGLVRFSELVEAFGPDAMVPPSSGVELLALLEVEGKPYRFAAARVAGRTFRGLLAGGQGKVWAGRFNLKDFPGVVRLVAKLLSVPPEAVKLVGPEASQE